MGKGGGSPAPSTQTVQQSNIPEYARPYFEDIMTRGTTASNVQYQPYTGERVAPFSPLQQQAFEGTQQLGPSPLIGAGAGLTGLAAQQAAQAGQYQPLAPQQMYQSPEFQGMGLEYLATQAPNLQQYQMGPAQQVQAAQAGAPMGVSAPQLEQFQMSPVERMQAAQTGAAMTDYAPQLQTFQMGPAERARTGSFAAPGSAEAYMSPYMQNVVDVQQREAQRQADIARTQRGAQAVGAGAFGGSRQAIMEAEAARNLALQKGDIQAQGLQSAYQQAQQAYQTDAARQLQAQLANQQAGLTVGQQNLASALGVQQLGTQTGLQTSLANQQAMQQAMMENARMQQQAGLANQQMGFNVGQQNLASALQTQGLGAQTGMQAQLANQQAMQQTSLANQQAAQQAALANQQAGLTVGQQNLAAALGVQQLGAQTGLQSQQLNQAAQLQAQQQALGQNQFANQFAQQNAQLAAQYGLAGLQAGEQSRQFGANLGMQGAGMLGQLGGQFGQLGQQAFGQQAGALQAQQQAGAIQQAQGQQQRDLAYEEFMRQQLYPQSQLQFLSSLLRGSVVAPQQTMYTYQQQPSAISQLGGLGLGALGMSRAFGAKEGGEVPGYADGGITGGDDKTQGVTPSRVTNVKKQLLSGIDPRKIPDPLGVMIALQDRDFVKQLQISAAAKNQQALEGGRQQAPSVYDEKMGEAAGLAGMDAGVMEEPYAGGGIVAFSGGKEVVAPPGIRYEPEEPAASPFGRFFQDIERGRRQNIEEEYLRRELMKRYGRQAGLEGLFSTQSDAERARAQAVLDRSKGMSLAELRDFAQNPEAGLPAALQQPAASKPAAPAAPAAAPKPRPEISPARAVATAAPAVKPEPVAPRTSLLYTGEKPEEAFARKEKEMETRFPSELKDRLEELKAQGQQAIKDRDADRWLAVAMGGFAAAAGQSPYALQNFAQGLGLTTKEIAAVNKDFRKAEDLRNKIMREETKIDRLERMQKYDAAEKARTRVEDITRDAQKADALYQAKLEELAIKRTGLNIERQKIGVMSKAYTDKADQLKVDYVNAVRSGDPKRIEAAKNALRMYTEATQPQRFEKPSDPLLAALTGGTGGGKGVVDFSKLPSQQKQ